MGPRKAPAMPAQIADELARRVVIENLKPQIDCGRSAIRRTPGESVEVTADIFADGHDAVRALLRYRSAGSGEWREIPMQNHGNDVFQGSFAVTEIGDYVYTIEAWIDRFQSWLQELMKKSEAEQDLRSELLEGAELIRQAAGKASTADARWLEQQAEFLQREGDAVDRVELARTRALVSVMGRYPDRSRSSLHPPLPMIIDHERARFGSWYEMFPRSCSTRPDRHGTLRDCIPRLDYIAGMGFDVLYLTPIHPIGKSFRKGPNNSLKSTDRDPGSPWAIGSRAGGHTAVHPELGTLQDFDALVDAARKRNIEIALDLAYQSSPDHPYVSEHPQWFRRRPDGTIKYAENPPKKYQDIYPFDFESTDWKSLWEELLQVALFWIDHGVRIFRVDNPHTKSFPLLGMADS